MVVRLLRPLVSRAHAVLQLGGLAAVTVGLGLAWLPLGVITAGVSLFAVGVLLEKER